MWSLAAILLAVPLIAAGAGPTELKASESKAWKLLKEGCSDSSDTNRAKAVQALGLISGDRLARELALKALSDAEPKVRAAAAAALGQMHARDAIPQLKKALDDQSSEVVFAAGESLAAFSDPAGYEFYYDVLTQERKGGGSLREREREILRHPKELSKLGIEQGIGFIPYGSLSLTMFRVITRDNETPVRASAARKLAHDPDPRSGQALVNALSDEKWLVRAPAAAAIAERNDSGLEAKVAQAMDDPAEIVQYTAAAATVHLGEIGRRFLKPNLTPKTSARPSD